MANGLSRSPTRLWVACKPSTVLADTAFGSVTSCCNVLNSSVLSGLPSFHRSGQTARSFGPDWLPTAPVRLAVAIADSTAEAVGFAVAAAIASCSSFSSEEVEPLAAALWLLALALPPVAGSPELWACNQPVVHKQNTTSTTSRGNRRVCRIIASMAQFDLQTRESGLRWGILPLTSAL